MKYRCAQRITQCHNFYEFRHLHCRHIHCNTIFLIYIYIYVDFAITSTYSVYIYICFFVIKHRVHSPRNYSYYIVMAHLHINDCDIYQTLELVLLIRQQAYIYIIGNFMRNVWHFLCVCACLLQQKFVIQSAARFANHDKICLYKHRTDFKMRRITYKNGNTVPSEVD